MRGPSGRGDEVAVDMDRVHTGTGSLIGPSSECHLVLDRGIATALAALQCVGGCQDLGTVADGSDRFMMFGKMLNHLENPRVESQVLGCTAARQDERVVTLGCDLVEIRIQREPMTGLFTVGLVAIEIVDGCGDVVPRLLVWTDNVACVSDHHQHLERNHDFVVFDEVAYEEEDFFCGQVAPIEVNG